MSREVSLECLGGGLESISDPRCVMRWCHALTFFLNLVPRSRPMHCHKIYLSPAISSPGWQSCLYFHNKVEYSHHHEQTWLYDIQMIILQSILGGLTLQGTSTGNPWWKERSPKDHPPHGSSSRSSFLVKRTRKDQVLEQEPVLRETHRKSMERVLYPEPVSFSNVGLSCLLPDFWRKVTERPWTCWGHIYRHPYGAFCPEFLA